MSVETVLEIRNSRGAKVYEFGEKFYSSATYARGINRIGKGEFVFPIAAIPRKALELLIARDTRINVLRAIDGGAPYIDMETSWLTRGADISNTTATVKAVDCVSLIDRRICAYYAASAQTRKSDYADNMIKNIAAENIASTASDYSGSTTRGLPASQFSIRADFSAAPLIKKEFAWRNLLAVYQEIAATSYEAGTFLAFDIVVPDINSGAFELRTYVGKRGVDRRAEFVLSEGNENFNKAVITYDYSDEKTHIYAGGKGQENLRVVDDAYSVVREPASVFNRIEKFVNAAHTDDPVTVADEATAAVMAGQPRIYISGDLVDSAQMRRGKNYELGDLVSAEVGGLRDDFIIDTVIVSVKSDGAPTSETVLQKYYE
jgi:hypothetical protein